MRGRAAESCVAAADGGLCSALVGFLATCGGDFLAGHSLAAAVFGGAGGDAAFVFLALAFGGGGFALGFIGGLLVGRGNVFFDVQDGFVGRQDFGFDLDEFSAGGGGAAALELGELFFFLDEFFGIGELVVLGGGKGGIRGFFVLGDAGLEGGDLAEDAEAVVFVLDEGRAGQIGLGFDLGEFGFFRGEFFLVFHRAVDQLLPLFNSLCNGIHLGLQTFGGALVCGFLFDLRFGGGSLLGSFFFDAPLFFLLGGVALHFLLLVDFGCALLDCVFAVLSF
jgi:hypothetical protein